LIELPPQSSLQPRAVGALPALQEGLNWVIGHPGLFALLPCLVLCCRALLAASAVLVFGVFELDRWFWETNGVALIHFSQDTWTLIVLAVVGLLVLEHLLVHLVAKAMLLTLRGVEWQISEMFSYGALASTAAVRLCAHVVLVSTVASLGLLGILVLPVLYAFYLVVDRALSPFAACARGGRMVVTHFGTVLLFECVSLGLLLGGLLACGMGVIPAYLITTAGRAALYDQLATTLLHSPKRQGSAVA
jgi:uncharacterized membrane protein